MFLFFFFKIQSLLVWIIFLAFYNMRRLNTWFSLKHVCNLWHLYMYASSSMRNFLVTIIWRLNKFRNYTDLRIVRMWDVQATIFQIFDWSVGVERTEPIFLHWENQIRPRIPSLQMSSHITWDWRRTQDRNNNISRFPTRKPIIHWPTLVLIEIIKKNLLNHFLGK